MTARGSRGLFASNTARPEVPAAFPALSTFDDHALQLRPVAEGFPDEARDVFHGGRAGALHIVEHAMVERVAHDADATFQIAHVRHPGVFGQRATHPHSPWYE